MQIDLQPFCGAATDPRVTLRSPLRLPDGAGIAASNGHIVVIIPDDWRDGVRFCPPDIAENIAKLPVEPFDDACLVQLDTMTLEPSQHCADCDGKGYQQFKPCRSCDGNGTFLHYGHKYECQECDGLGEVDSDADDTPKRHCSRCNGSGIEFATQCVNDAKFQTRYLALLQTLPGCKLSVRDKHGAARFEFDGGYGWLMPVIQ